jgi:hypothetical protein
LRDEAQNIRALVTAVAEGLESAGVARFRLDQKGRILGGRVDATFLGEIARATASAPAATMSVGATMHASVARASAAAHTATMTGTQQHREAPTGDGSD